MKEHQMLRNFTLVCLVLGSTTFAAADPADQCASVKDLLAKAQPAKALAEATAIRDLALDKFVDALRALIPDKVGTFAMEKNDSSIAASIPGKRNTGNFVSYRADGLPMMNVMIGSGAIPGGGGLECSGKAPNPNVEGPVKVNERDAFTRKQIAGRFSASLCLKGGSVGVTSDSATKEQLLQFLKDFPAANIAKIEELIAPLAEQRS